jgi:hypothetical protein
MQAQRGLGELRLLDFLHRHYMVVGCQPHTPVAFTPRDIPGTHFHEGLSRPQGHGLVGRKYVTLTRPGIDPGTVRLVAQRLNLVKPSGFFTYHQV